MISKIKNLIQTIKRNIACEICYKKQEKLGIGIFGLCRDYKGEECLKCNYWLDWRKADE